jgi:phosphate starvation-inducible membrane PsiE
MRKHTDLECGCFGVKHNQKISIKLVSRNFLLLTMALCIMLWGGGLLTLDSRPLIFERLSIDGTFLPLMLTCLGALVLILLVRQLLRLVLLMPLEE